MDTETNNTENQINARLSWSLKRKIIYISIIIAVLLLIVAVPLISSFSKEPTCEDNKKNQNETGVDCGGVCEKICSSEVSEPIVLWSKAFKVSEEIYNVLALVENRNINSESSSSPFVFRLKDREGNILAERKSQTFIPNSQVVAIFEQGLNAKGEVAMTEFEFAEKTDWTKTLAPTPDISIRSQKLYNVETSPRLQVEIENRSLQDINKLEVVAVIFDSQGEALGSSRTIVDNFESGKISKITFTWNQPFTRDICDSVSSEICTESPTTIEILTKAIPDAR